MIDDTATLQFPYFSDLGRIETCSDGSVSVAAACSVELLKAFDGDLSKNV
jgi:hypothetical protein